MEIGYRSNTIKVDQSQHYPTCMVGMNNRHKDTRTKYNNKEIE